MVMAKIQSFSWNTKIYEGSFSLVSGSGKRGAHNYILRELSAGEAQETPEMCPGGCWALVPMGSLSGPVEQPLPVHVLSEKGWRFQPCLSH